MILLKRSFYEKYKISYRRKTRGGASVLSQRSRWIRQTGYWSKDFTLAEVPEARQHIKNLSKTAFTLAEVLITLAIIGIVAAMTIPILLSKYQEKELTQRWLRVYSLLSQAYQSLQVEYGDFSTWPKTADDTYEKFKSKFRISADCPKDTDKTKCYASIYTSMDGSNLGFGTAYSAFRLISGESLIFVPYIEAQTTDIIVDLNGSAGPNKFGIDTFYFSLSREIMKYHPETNTSEYIGERDTFRIRPAAHFGWVDTPELCYPNKPQMTMWYNGTSCGFWIQKYHNMDYLHLPYEEIQAKWGKWD